MKELGTKCGKFIDEKWMIATFSPLEGVSKCVLSGSVSVMGYVLEQWSILKL